MVTLGSDSLGAFIKASQRASFKADKKVHVASKVVWSRGTTIRTRVESLLKSKLTLVLPLWLSLSLSLHCDVCRQLKCCTYEILVAIGVM